ncbi:DUF4139 domain-containing protein [Jeotgalibacillus proteolyticus]|uniref:DUF4139 domain-containing protein n=1 Tax=Jeotgalibacillus proteolyticus TaxID=2082395 RepID=A0A2S5GG08_9BACL|nr:hypothetical protein [Jeotgalibacillus proteolyticus]PPA71851.1 hypothetical protein C4B60_00280 [Jeotgalibacillus proteolyticus]
MHLVVYEGDFALVTEKRNLSDAPAEWLLLTGFPNQMDPLSLTLTGLTALEWTIKPPVGVNERAILKEMEGEVILFGLKGEKKERYRLIASDPDLILEHMTTNEIYLNPSGEIAILSMPESVSNQPQFIIRLNQTDWPKTATLTYIVNKIRWSARYIAILQDRELHLKGTIAIENHSGTTLENLSLQVIAGEVKRLRGKPERPNESFMKMASSEQLGEEGSEEGAGELHLYTIPFDTSLPNKHTKMIPYIELDTPYRLYYVATPQAEHPETEIEWKHRSEVPLAKGVITFYYQLPEQLLFAGQDSFPYTPKDKLVHSHLGRANDIDSVYDLIKSYMSGEDMFEEHRYVLTNRKDQDAEIIITQPVYHQVWEVAKTSDPVTDKTANELKISVVLKPGETKSVLFTLKYPNTNKRV